MAGRVRRYWWLLSKTQDNAGREWKRPRMAKRLYDLVQLTGLSASLLLHFNFHPIEASPITASYSSSLSMVACGGDVLGEHSSLDGT